MSAKLGGKSLPSSQGAKMKPKVQDVFLKVKRSELEKITTEVMQLQELLPGLLKVHLGKLLYEARAAQKLKKQVAQEQKKLRQECLRLQSQLAEAQAKFQKETEEKLLLRKQLWQSRTELQQQTEFCSALGSASCVLLWSSSVKENTVTQWLADRKLQPFLTIACQSLEKFFESVNEDVTMDQNSQEHQFVLAVAGTITNIAAVARGRDFLSSSAHGLLDTLMKLLQMMKPAAFPKLKVLMLKALYNVSISVKGLKYISESPTLLPLIWNLLGDGDVEVCLFTLRLLQSMMAEEEVQFLLRCPLLDPGFQNRISQLTSGPHPSLRLAAQQTLEDLQTLQQVRLSQYIRRSSSSSKHLLRSVS